MEIIRKHLEELNDNDILVYCDSGSTLNYLAKQRFFEYIDIVYLIYFVYAFNCNLFFMICEIM